MRTTTAAATITEYLVTTVDLSVSPPRPEASVRCATGGEARDVAIKTLHSMISGTHSLQDAETHEWSLEGGRWQGEPRQMSVGDVSRLDIDPVTVTAFDGGGAWREPTWEQLRQADAARSTQEAARKELRRLGVTDTEPGWDAAVAWLSSGRHVEQVYRAQRLAPLLTVARGLPATEWEGPEALAASPLEAAAAWAERDLTPADVTAALTRP